MLFGGEERAVTKQENMRQRLESKRRKARIEGYRSSTSKQIGILTNKNGQFKEIAINHVQRGRETGKQKEGWTWG
jgi:hypothetical protein